MTRLQERTIDYGRYLTGGLSVVVLALADKFPTYYWWAIGCTLGFLLSTSVMEVYYRRNQNAKAKDTLEVYRHCLRPYLMREATETLPRPLSTMRISVYAYDKSADNFFQIGRYSHNKAYDGESERSYPKDAGAVGAAWKTGCQLATIKADPNEDLEGYRDELVCKWQMKRADVERLSMRPRQLLGKRIDSEVSDASGVVLIETTEKVLSEKELELLKQLSADRWIIQIIHAEYYSRT